MEVLINFAKALREFITARTTFIAVPGPAGVTTVAVAGAAAYSVAKFEILFPSPFI